ncbi:hypothetical protein [Acinetobacter lanii]|uniref:LTXXQ motif protein n=1 Tax=Acinetobacter lanii TaxID=2715163 RepID=A0A6G8S1P2_9GAMM|nr:hypothetical protein [Acinetobacter lanii]QIO08034.1 hypothetical protein G8D99_02695 [Acinetobacter lanii]
MNTMSKIAILTASVLSVGALTACQTTTAPKDAKGAHQFDGRHADRMDRKMSPEQREAFKARQEQRKQAFEQIKKACDGKAVGQAVQVKLGEKTIDGSCAIHFKADRKDMQENMKKMRAEHHPMKGEHRPMRGDIKNVRTQHEPLTDAKRAELTQKFEQRLAERQARQQAIAKACQGQSNGKAVQIKLGEHTVNGQCEVRFQPKAPIAPTAPKAA